MAAAILTAGTLTANAQSLEIEVANIRNDKGSVLLMIRTDDGAAPIYRMEPARTAGVTFRVDSLTAQHAEISLFHDENGNYELDKDEQGMPREGFGGKKCKLRKPVASVRIPVTYLKEE